MLIYPLTISWGLIGAGWAVTAAYLAGLILNSVALSRLLENFLQIILGAVYCPLLATAALVASSLLIGTVLEGMGSLPRFFLLIFSGIGAFLLISIWMKNALIVEVARSLSHGKFGAFRA